MLYACCTEYRIMEDSLLMVLHLDFLHLVHNHIHKQSLHLKYLHKEMIRCFPCRKQILCEFHESQKIKVSIRKCFTCASAAHETWECVNQYDKHPRNFCMCVWCPKYSQTRTVCERSARTKVHKINMEKEKKKKKNEKEKKKQIRTRPSKEKWKSWRDRKGFGFCIGFNLFCVFYYIFFHRNIWVAT